MDGKPSRREIHAVARFSPEHKEATRRRMIPTAGRRFEGDSIDGSGVGTLVASDAAQQLQDRVSVVDGLPQGLASFEVYLRVHLSPAHRDDLAGGSPSAALLDEIGRCDGAVRGARPTPTAPAR
jgi:hypothetical protein